MYTNASNHQYGFPSSYPAIATTTRSDGDNFPPTSTTITPPMTSQSRARTTSASSAFQLLSSIPVNPDVFRSPMSSTSSQQDNSSSILSYISQQQSQLITQLLTERGFEKSKVDFFSLLGNTAVGDRDGEDDEDKEVIPTNGVTSLAEAHMNRSRKRARRKDDARVMLLEELRRIAFKYKRITSVLPVSDGCMPKNNTNQTNSSRHQNDVMSSLDVLSEQILHADIDFDTATGVVLPNAANVCTSDDNDNTASSYSPSVASQASNRVHYGQMQSPLPTPQSSFVSATSAITAPAANSVHNDRIPAYFMSPTTTYTNSNIHNSNQSPQFRSSRVLILQPRNSDISVASAKSSRCSAFDSMGDNNDSNKKVEENGKSGTRRLFPGAAEEGRGSVFKTPPIFRGLQ